MSIWTFFTLMVRQKLRERKIRAEHEKKVGAVIRFVRSAVADETGHAGGVGIVMLEPLLAAEGISDSGLHLVGEGEDFVAGIAAAVAAEDGDRLGIVDHLSELFQVGFGRTKNRLGRNGDGMEAVRRLRSRDVAAERYDGGTAVDDGSRDGGVEDGAGLFGIHDAADVEARQRRKTCRDLALRGQTCRSTSIRRRQQWQ